MKKMYMVLGGALLLAGILTGCQTADPAQGETEATETRKETAGTQTEETGGKDLAEAEEREVTSLVWESSQNFRSHEKYFNQILREKGYPYEVTFIESDGQQAADLKEVPWTWMEPYDAAEEILAGSFLDLSGYLETEEGRVIRDSLPENVWDAYRVDGKTYTALSVGFVPAKTVYIWDTELAGKYDVHPEEWNGKLWEYADELEKVCRGEKGTNDFVTVQGARLYGQYLEGMTQALGVCYPFAVRETEEVPQAELLYETPEYKEYLEGMKILYERGIYDPAVEENQARSNTSFLRIETDFKTKDAYTAWEGEDFWKTHEVAEIWQPPLWRLSVCAQETGISVDSAHPDEAFSLLCKLYGDADLINALMWGEEGKNYALRGNTAEKPVTGGYLPALYVGNNFLAYAEVGQDEKKKELYPEWLAKCEDSGLKGFEFSGKPCEEELQAICQVALDWEGRSGKDVLLEHEKLIQDYREAGADRVLEEWNRQYRAWSEKQE